MYLEHVNLTVSDLDRSIGFYCDLLELHVRWKGPIDGERLGAHVGDDRCYLALFQGAADGTVDRDYSRPGLNHFGFVVDDLRVWARPVDVVVAHDGSLFVTEDGNGTIWRVAYAPNERSGEVGQPPLP